MSDSAGDKASRPGGRPPWSFVQWHKAGFEKLITILPVDAALGPNATAELRDVCGKAPGRLDAGSTVWRLFHKWPIARHVREDYERWDAYVVPEHRAGIGLVLGDVIAIDIDVLERALALPLRSLAEQHFGKGAWRIGNDPKAAMLLRLKEGAMPFRKRTLTLTAPGWAPTDKEKDTPHKIEILANGQQVVVEGIHAKTRKPYMWLDGHPAVSGRASLGETDLPAVDAFLRDAVQLAEAHNWTVGKVRGYGGESGVDAKTPEQLRCPDVLWPVLLDCVKRYPNTVAREEWIRMAFSLRGAAGPDRAWSGYDAFYTWSKDWKGGNSDAMIEAAWDKVKPTHLGWESLADDLKLAGIHELSLGRAAEAFYEATREGTAEGARAQAHADAQASVRATGVSPSPFWKVEELLAGPAFDGTRARIQAALDTAGAASPQDPDEAYLRIRIAMIFFGRVAWLNTGWVEYVPIIRKTADGTVIGTEIDWPGIWSPVDESQLELRIESLIRLWLDQYCTRETLVAKMRTMLSKSGLRAPRMRALMLLGPDSVLGETPDPTSLMEEASNALIALPGGRCVEWGTGIERDIRRRDCVLAALRIVPAPKMVWALAPHLHSLLNNLFGGWDDPLEPMPPHWSWLQAWCGYMLAGCRPEQSEQAALVLRGEGGEGKGTFFRLCREVLGAYAGEISIDQLVRGKTPHANDEVAPMLRGKRVLFVAEASGEGMLWRDDLVKALIGNDEIRGRLMTKDGVRVRSRIVLMMAGNVMPKWQTHDRSVQRRFWWIRAPARVKADHDFWRKLLPEAPMLLRWMLDGVKLWRTDTLKDDALRGDVIKEDIDGRAGDSSSGFFEGLTTRTKAFSDVMSELIQPLLPGTLDAALQARDTSELDWLKCIPVSHVPFVAAAWMHKMRQDGEVPFPLLAWERVRPVMVAAMRDFMNSDAGKPYRLSRRYGAAQRRYLLANVRDALPEAISTMVDRFIRFMLNRPMMEFRRLGAIPADLPGLEPDIVAVLRARRALDMGGI